MMISHYHISVSGVLMMLVMVSPFAAFDSDKEIHIKLITHSDIGFGTANVRIAVQLAIQHVMTHYGLPNGYNIKSFFYNDFRTSDYLQSEFQDDKEMGELDAIIGPVEGVDQVAAIGEQLNTPVISLGVEFYNATKGNFPLLTSVGPIEHLSMANMFLRVMEIYKWKKVKLIFQNPYYNEERGEFVSTYCPTAMHILKSHLEGHGIKTKLFATKEDDIPLSYLQSETGRQYTIVVLCATQKAVREFMIQAHSLNLHNGDYVFFNIDYFSRSSRPWYNMTDDEERNTKAANAYLAVQTIRLKKPPSPQYSMFSGEIKRRARQLFPRYTSTEGPLNPFVGYFHDAVMLYALAAKEALDAGIPLSDGRRITQLMRNRTFEGITGSVTVDKNGVRLIDYSILQMNDLSNQFEVVLNYFGKTGQMNPVSHKSIRWPGGRSEPPKDEIANPNAQSIASQSGTVSLLVVIMVLGVCVETTLV